MPASPTEDAPPAGDALPTSWSRAVITAVDPSVDGGRWPVKRAAGEPVHVRAGVVVDGHEKLAVELHYRHAEDEEARVLRMQPEPNDEYTAAFTADRLGRYQYRVRAWIDRFATWQDQFQRRVEGGETETLLASELQEGAALLRRAARHAEGAEGAEGADAPLLDAQAEALSSGDPGSPDRSPGQAWSGAGFERALQPGLAELVRRHLPADAPAESDWLELQVDPPHAVFAAWYEFFPRSAPSESAHATLDDAARLLPRIKELGFDVVYLPPVHPIGATHRKGKDNAPQAGPEDPGSPWAIGSAEGGHKAVHPELGGLAAFDRFVEKAEDAGLKVALDIAFQTSPDHPYVEKHPEWFYRRPDGSIRYAENPPKKYQDVYPLRFEGEDARGLWAELKTVFQFWIDRGVQLFRVDNPHTKPFAFWRWCIAELRAEHPEVVFLAEAFTRPKIMYHLAKIGFNNSYTYFAWRTTRHELESYGRELFQTEAAEFFRPSFWPNTPDILTEELAHGGRPAHVARLVLAATLSPLYGVYGPPYEHVFHRQHPEREEYAENEKYEIRSWNWNDPHSLQPLMQRVNRIRRENPALQRLRGLRFHETMNDHLIAYTRQASDNLVLVVVNLDPYVPHEGQIALPLHVFGMAPERPFEVHDLLGGERYQWQGERHYVRIDPHQMPAHIFRLQRRHRTEKDYDNIVN